ncbi:hypothetical protein M441DRAFT_356676 [Trichoderma asperellum CBS 433.97]|uniref:Uncharacterized protein n=1 Tax=Trichoderma asperellum (strain ATCC 204424 / CBS 433.97 / NBRC 101777) TaxID=1042311 RepID=A0A2T3YQY2_TRIA4|nr:hypothetical protein M441DRAFT_356676 [Trichoderma asperellum CBS 433.97]PTB34929.1 hypothetical protein M441DRAFT_356676 [Trichoderma asperellum CBS 433.97]
MDSPNITKPRTGTSSPSYQEDPPSEEVMNRILALRTEKERLKAELADSHIKIKKLASEILSLRELVCFHLQHLLISCLLRFRISGM